MKLGARKVVIHLKFKGREILCTQIFLQLLSQLHTQFQLLLSNITNESHNTCSYTSLLSSGYNLDLWSELKFTNSFSIGMIRGTVGAGVELEKLRQEVLYFVVSRCSLPSSNVALKSNCTQFLQLYEKHLSSYVCYIVFLTLTCSSVSMYLLV